MPVARLKEFLDRNAIKYVSITHSKAFTAMDIAESAHIRGRDIAKTVVVKLDGRLALAVVPGTRKVDVERLRKGAGATTAELAKEPDFQGDFPGCELGAMPPFGNLFDMDVFVEPSLAQDDDIAFNAGSHTELIRMSYSDFERLVKPMPVAM